MAEREAALRAERARFDAEDLPPRRAPASLVPAPTILSRRQGVQRRPAAAAAAAAAAPRRHSVDFARPANTTPPPSTTFTAPSPLQHAPVLDAVETRGYGIDDAYDSPEFDVPVASEPTERTRLTGGVRSVHYDEPSSTPSSGGARSRTSMDGYEDDPEYANSVYMLSLSILMITSVVFVIIVSGLTKIVSRRASERFTIESDWQDGSFIPDRYGCKAPGGKPESFPLSWRNVPPTATNLVILFANPTSLSEANNDPVHWFVTDIPLVDANGTKVNRLPANSSLNPMLMPPSAKQRPNIHYDSGNYYPPCPKDESKNLFVLHVYAIDASAVIDTYKDARQIMNRFVGVPSARLSGTYDFEKRVIEITGKDSAENSSQEDHTPDKQPAADSSDATEHKSQREVAQHAR